MINRTFITLVILLVCGLSPAAASAEPALSDILKNVRENYQDLPGLTLTYRREILSASMSLLGEKGNRDSAAGLIHFKPPYFLRIDQQEPRDETVVSDGEKLWWHIPAENEVYVYSAQRSARELRLMSGIFQGLKQVEESFVVSLSEEEGAENLRIQLIPEPAWPQTESIMISVSPDTYQIKGVEIRDYVGGLTRFIIKEQSVRENFQKDFFKLDIPENTRVIEGEG